MYGNDPIKVDLNLFYSRASNINSIIAPFNYYNSLVILRGKIGEQEGNFILDTGANGLVLNSNYFDASRMLNADSYGLSGSINEVGESEIKELNLDQLSFNNVNAQVINLQPVERNKKLKILGLIGYEVLQDFEIMFNYRERYITFSRVDRFGNIIDPLPHTFAKIDSFNLRLGNFIPVISVKVGNEEKWMGIDSGAEYNVLDIRRNKDVMENFQVENRVNIVGTDGRRVQGLVGRLFRLRLDDRYKCAGMATILLKLNSFDQIYGMKLDGILGHPFLAPWLFSINYKKKILYIHKFTFDRT